MTSCIVTFSIAFYAKHMLMAWRNFCLLRVALRMHHAITDRHVGRSKAL